MSKKIWNIAIVGATGAVGEVMREILESRDFPVDKLYLLASERSAGTRLNFKGQHLIVQDLATFDFTQADIALFSAGGSISAKYAPIAAKAGCVVIDNTSHFRYEPDIPLVIPEVNGAALKDFTRRNIIANPNCSTMQMLVALQPIHQLSPIKRINVATYQAVSGSGKQAIEELARQTTQLMSGQEATVESYPHRIAFNLLPHIDSFEDNGYTREEMKMVWETRKILGDETIQVNPTAVRVPVFYGHSEAVHLETEQPLELDTVRQVLQSAPGVEVLDDPEQNLYAMPAVHATGTDEVFVSRIRRDISHPAGLNLWIVSDNIRKGAALNTVQIAERLIAEYL